MAQDLRGRLRRIKEIRNRGEPENPAVALRTNPPGETKAAGTTGTNPPGVLSPSLGSEWSSAGFLSLKRTVRPDQSPEFSGLLPAALDILVPDIIAYSRDQGPPELFDLLFFDLETTGLSGGAGTTAFLAAFGRFVQEKRPAASPSAASVTQRRHDSRSGKPARLRVVQYLLLDYPGEGDFLAAVLSELRTPAPSGRLPLVVSYNGKSFDSQILKIRCLMNGIVPPVFYHADLLHPCRRLWKRLLPACSQGNIETAILGIDRTGDIPGALAPEIWFSFLRTGETADLLKICNHNTRDVAGLAALLIVLARIAEDPAAAPTICPVDLENLALRWFYAPRSRGPEQGRAETLLAAAAEQSYPRAAYVWARELIRRGNGEEGARRLLLITGGEAPRAVKAAAYRVLAMDAEWRLRDPRRALEYTELFFAPENVHPGLHVDMRKRRERLLKKTN
jgi:uncharacterized protein YprB with RNaseH-like and TPR domain